MSITSPTLAATRAGRIGRSVRDDQEARERQMQQDIESAMSMCEWLLPHLRIKTHLSMGDHRELGMMLVLMNSSSTIRFDHG